MSTDVHAHCIPPEVLKTLENEPDRFGMEIVQDGPHRRVVIAGRVSTGRVYTATSKRRPAH